MSRRSQVDPFQPEKAFASFLGDFPHRFPAASRQRRADAVNALQVYNLEVHLINSISYSGPRPWIQSHILAAGPDPLLLEGHLPTFAPVLVSFRAGIYHPVGTREAVV